MRRYVLNAPLTALLAAAFLAAMAPVATMTLRSDSADWSAQAQAIVDQQVADMTTGRDCTTADQPRLVDRVLVRNARLRDGDTAVARWVTFDQAYDDATAGRIVVLRYCA